MSEARSVDFDSSLPTLVQAIVEHLGASALDAGVIARDTSGRLLFLSDQPSPPDERRAELSRQFAATLGPYARPDGVVAYADDPGIRPLLEDPAAFPMFEGSLVYRLLDRRIVGSAWVESPVETAHPPRIVFASLKGGVGRSTALALTASDLARRGKNVLIFDLDLEAPGVGGMLLDDDRMPLFGAVDFLVENGLGGVADRELADFVGTSALTSPSGGRVDVVPALGIRAIAHPRNVLAKLSRAMIEDIGANGQSTSLVGQIAEMVDRFARRESYDVVLIDSRAGMSELAAPALLGLGAYVLLFGTAQRQTLHGYAALLAALGLLAQRDRTAERPSDWRLRFKLVLAKAGKKNKTNEWYRDEMYELFAANLYDRDDPSQDDPEAVAFDIDDTDAPHWPLVIPFDANLIEFDPAGAPSQLATPSYESTYRPFLDGIDELISNANTGAEENGLSS